MWCNEDVQIDSKQEKDAELQHRIAPRPDADPHEVPVIDPQPSTFKITDGKGARGGCGGGAMMIGGGGDGDGGGGGGYRTISP